ncbi:MAG: GHKL domain-containing protein [Clostridium argentinense]|uniref:histidine kinase n=1 Tax=Clostridium faecium TaxID=2762223 RepID=A0ABR8YWB9_9CLOT|nr:MULTISPECIES: ATP-binding protein [Clostridium]MBD8048293.1 GHKL domain-containing protein [Clostridium faecium]MBS5823044.1 GHKL domain-containing protein [Clostridium argentinense]MDU1349204.1 ATP-binding protein [Clostridium argentinense]
MFHKLKRKFIIINMTLLTVVFIAIFSTIYIMTMVSAARQTEFILNTLMHAPPKPSPNNPAIASSIIVELDKQHNIVDVFSLFDIEKESIEEAISEAIKSKKLSKNLKIEGSSYAFLKQDTPRGMKIVFVDRSPQHTMVINLLKIFFLVGGISLIILLLISMYFANRTIKPIKEVFEKQKQFITDASHELKTPLTIIKTNTALVLSNSEETVKSQSKWIGYINSQTDRMSKLIDDMLSLAKLDNPQHKVCFSSFDISKTLENILLSFEAVIYENDIELDFNINKNIFINGEKESIKKLFNILMDNAIKNTPSRGKISVKLDCDKSKIEVEVKNTGEGISKEHIDKIFERFYRVDDSRNRESGGYGLGLSIAKSIVNEHNGNIYVKSNINEYTSFIVELPQTVKL